MGNRVSNASKERVHGRECYLRVLRYCFWIVIEPRFATQLTLFLTNVDELQICAEVDLSGALEIASGELPDTSSYLFSSVISTR